MLVDTDTLYGGNNFSAKYTKATTPAFPTIYIHHLMNWTFKNTRTIIHKCLFEFSLCIASIAVACLSLLLMGRYHIPIADDLSYQFVFYGGNVFLDGDGSLVPADSLSKVVNSQIYHYANINGRSIVHFIIQCFDGLWGYVYYTLVSPFLLAVTLILFIRYTCPKSLHLNPLVWIGAIIIWMYLYPSPIGAFHWLVYGMNYLYPMCMVLCFLTLYTYFEQHGTRATVIRIIVIVLFGIVAGWSQEGFSVPLAAAMFLHTCLRKNTSSLQSYMNIGLWIGTIILVLAPGNFNRIDITSTASMSTKTLYAFFYYLDFRLFWPSLAIILAAFMADRRKFIIQMERYSILWECWIISILFSTVAHSGTWSFMSMEFYSATTMFSTIPIIADKIRIPRILTNTLAVILLLTISIHQYFIISTAAKIYHAELGAINTLKASRVANGDVIISYPDIDIHPYVRPWVFRYWSDGFKDYNIKSFSVMSGNIGKRPVFVGEKDYDAIFNPELFFVKQNLVPGNSHIYDGNLYYWVKSKEFSADNAYLINYSPVKPIECPHLLIALKSILTPDSPAFVNSEPINPADITSIPHTPDSLIPIKKVTWRTVSSITCNKK